MAPFRKGTDILLQAFYNMKNRKKAKLIIHSQVNLSKIFPDLSSQIKEMCNDKTLQIIEKTVTAPGLYYLGDVYVYPSRLDGIGLTLMEAISSGLPIITIDNAPMNEFADESFALLCDVEYFYCRYDAYYWPMSVANISSLTEKLNWFITNNDKLNEMSINARRYALSELDFEKNMGELHRILNDVSIKSIDKSLVSNIYNYDRSHFTVHRFIINWFKETLKRSSFIRNILNR